MVNEEYCNESIISRKKCQSNLLWVPGHRAGSAQLRAGKKVLPYYHLIPTTLDKHLWKPLFAALGSQHNPAIEAGNLPRPFSEHIICTRACARRARVGQQHIVRTNVRYINVTKLVQQHKSQSCTVLALVWYNNTRPKLNHTWLRSSTVYGCFTFVKRPRTFGPHKEDNH